MRNARLKYGEIARYLLEMNSVLFIKDLRTCVLVGSQSRSWMSDSREHFLFGTDSKLELCLGYGGRK